MANYRRGRAFEYRVRDFLKKHFCDIVVRSAGSKGEFDLIGIHYATGIVRLVSCRNKKRWASTEKQKLRLILKKLPKTGFMIMLVWNERGKIVFEYMAQREGY